MLFSGEGPPLVGSITAKISMNFIFFELYTLQNFFFCITEMYVMYSASVKILDNFSKQREIEIF